MDGILAFFGNLGTQELLVIAMIGLLLFGKRLPEVGKSLGKTLVEFKKGLHGIEDEIEQATRDVQPMLTDSSSSPSAPAATTPPEYQYSTPSYEATTPEATTSDTTATSDITAAGASVASNEPATSLHEPAPVPHTPAEAVSTGSEPHHTA